MNIIVMMIVVLILWPIYAGCFLVTIVTRVVNFVTVVGHEFFQRFDLSNQISDLHETNLILEDYLKEFKAFSANIGKVRQCSEGFESDDSESSEHKVTEAVYEELSKQFHVLQDREIYGEPELNVNIRDSENNIVCEVDGLIYLSAHQAAIVEVKTLVTMETVQQFIKTADTVKKAKKVETVLLYLGGPLSDESVKQFALKSGIHVVEVNDGRYRIESPAN